jgi:peptide/nickel transport system permease protein
MARYALGRLLATVPVLLTVAVAVFLLIHLSPGDPASVIGGDHATPADIERIRAGLGFDRPLIVQFGIWLLQLVRGDLGRSIFSDFPVTTLIASRMGATISLALCTIVLAVAVAVPLGIIAAVRAGTLFDRLIMAVSVLGFSVPAFCIAYALIFGIAVAFDLLPVQGYVPLSQDPLRFLAHMILPSFTLSFAYIALIARMTRASMLEVIGKDFIRTARAKGVAPRTILVRHALRNASIPIVTTIGIGLASLLGGVVVTESVFAIPGLGRLTVDAILRRDYPVIQGVILVFATTYVMINLLIDLSYSLLDPRIANR